MYEQNEDELRRQIMLRSQRKPLIGNEQTAGVAQGVVNAGQMLFGGKPQQQDSTSRLADQMALANYKEGLKDPEAEALKRDDIQSRIDLREKIGSFGGNNGEDGQEGFTTVNGRVVRDPAYKRLPTPEERGIELEDEVAKSELTSMSKALPKLDQADQAAGQLKGLYDRAVKPESVEKGDLFGGLMYRASGIPKTVMGMSGANPELNRYSADRKAFSGLISKGGFGEAGMLTQQDIERVASILPNEYSTKEESDIAWEEVKNILGSARKRFEEKKNSYKQGAGAFSSMKTPSIPGAVSSNQNSFNSPEEADSSGLPPGTKVTVNGRPYEIG